MGIESCSALGTSSGGQLACICAMAPDGLLTKCYLHATCVFMHAFCSGLSVLVTWAHNGDKTLMHSTPLVPGGETEASRRFSISAAIGQSHHCGECKVPKPAGCAVPPNDPATGAGRFRVHECPHAVTDTALSLCMQSEPGRPCKCGRYDSRDSKACSGQEGRQAGWGQSALPDSSPAGQWRVCNSLVSPPSRPKQIPRQYA